MLTTYDSLDPTQQQAVNWLVELKLGEALRTGSRLAASDPDKFRQNARDSEAELLMRGKSDIAQIFSNPPAREALEAMYNISKQKLVNQFAEKAPPAAPPKKRWFF